jgi:hypothetical protein
MIFDSDHQDILADLQQVDHVDHFYTDTYSNTIGLRHHLYLL